MHKLGSSRTLLSPVQVVAPIQAMVAGGFHGKSANDKSSTSAHLARESVLIARRPDRYRIELKGWIPHDRVIDPDVLLRPKAYVGTAAALLEKVIEPKLLDYLPVKLDVAYKYISVYRGDGHRTYNGSYRARAVLSFTFDGRKLRMTRHSDKFGITHRDWSASAHVRVYLDAVLAEKDIKKFEIRRKGVQRGLARGKTIGKTTGPKSFYLAIRTKNPLLMRPSRKFAPHIDAILVGSFVNHRVLAIAYQANKFPSWGFRIIKNGRPVLVHQIYDASAVHARGPIGALNLARRMVSWHRKRVRIRFR